MKNFSQFVEKMNDNVLSYSAFLVSRVSMPQLHVPTFIEFVDRLGIEYTKSFDTVESFKPTQIDFDEYKVRNIAMDMRKSPDNVKKLTAILVSEDGYVLDGHHRFYAAKREGIAINFIVVALPINKLLKLALDFVEYEKAD